MENNYENGVRSATNTLGRKSSLSPFRSGGSLLLRVRLRSRFPSMSPPRSCPLSGSSSSLCVSASGPAPST